MTFGAFATAGGGLATLERDLDDAVDVGRGGSGDDVRRACACCDDDGLVGGSEPEAPAWKRPFIDGRVRGRFIAAGIVRRVAETLGDGSASAGDAGGRADDDDDDFAREASVGAS
jgi:hypothetical protein